MTKRQRDNKNKELKQIMSGLQNAREAGYTKDYDKALFIYRELQPSMTGKGEKE